MEMATRVPLPILGLAGIGISSYLTYMHYKNLEPICFFNAKCDVVLTSPYAQMWGFPLSLLGLLMYVFLTILASWRLLVKDDKSGMLDLGIYGTALSGTLFTLYLYYLEIFEIHAFCTWCIGSSIVIFLIFTLSVINYFKYRPEVNEKLRRRRFKLSDYVRW